MLSGKDMSASSIPILLKAGSRTRDLTRLGLTYSFLARIHREWDIHCIVAFKRSITSDCPAFSDIIVVQAMSL